MAKKRTFREFKQGSYRPMNPAKCLNKNKIEYRSGLERQLMIILDKNPNVLAWSSEAIVIPYKHPMKSARDGVPVYARYFVDFYMKLKVGEVIKEYIVEVKPDKKTRAPTTHGNKKQSTILYENAEYAINTAKWEAARAYCKKKNYTFILITEKNIDSLL